MNKLLISADREEIIVDARDFIKSTVLYPVDSKWVTKMKNNSIVVMNPSGMKLLLKDIDNQWKVQSWTEEF